ncbi:hypothetical protein Tco_0689670 [Tanacetum coccineum]
MTPKKRRVLWGLGFLNVITLRDDIAKRDGAGLQSFPRTLWIDRSGKQLIQWPVQEIELPSCGILKEGRGVLDTTSVDPQALCTERGASSKGAFGPFGLLAMASKDLEEQTAIFFRVFQNQMDRYSVSCLCSDNFSRSTVRSNIDTASFGAFVDIDPQYNEISLRQKLDPQYNEISLGNLVILWPMNRSKMSPAEGRTGKVAFGSNSAPIRLNYAESAMRTLSLPEGKMMVLLPSDGCHGMEYLCKTRWKACISHKLLVHIHLQIIAYRQLQHPEMQPSIVGPRSWDCKSDRLPKATLRFPYGEMSLEENKDQEEEEVLTAPKLAVSASCTCISYCHCSSSRSNIGQ